MCQEHELLSDGTQGVRHSRERHGAGERLGCASGIIETEELFDRELEATVGTISKGSGSAVAK